MNMTKHNGLNEPQPSVPGPNTPPTGSRFDTSSENYVGSGFPQSPPEWLVKAAAEFRCKKLSKDIGSVALA